MLARKNVQEGLRKQVQATDDEEVRVATYKEVSSEAELCGETATYDVNHTYHFNCDASRSSRYLIDQRVHYWALCEQVSVIQF